VTDRHTKQRAHQAAEAVLYHCLAHGLSFKVSQGNVLQLSPPLIITRQELDKALDILHSALLAVSQQMGYSH
ncbi:MAG: aspartate aminotransferase family protein, partial [Vibrio sp.]